MGFGISGTLFTNAPPLARIGIRIDGECDGVRGVFDGAGSPAASPVDRECRFVRELSGDCVRNAGICDITRRVVVFVGGMPGGADMRQLQQLGKLLLWLHADGCVSGHRRFVIRIFLQ